MIIVHEQKPSIYLQVSYIGQHLYKSGFYCTSTGKNLSFFVFSKVLKFVQYIITLELTPLHALMFLII